ncbi:serine hydrolase [Candidatus Omnitrophota bacterium]
MKKLTKMATCLLLISVFISSHCIFAQETRQKKISERWEQWIEEKQKIQDAQSPPALETKYENKEYGFSINYPKDYTKEKPKPKEIFRARSKGKLPLLTISMANIAEDTTFADLKDIYLKKLKANIKFLSDNEITLSDGVTPAYESVVESKIGKIDLKTLNLWVINRNQWFLVTATTTPRLWSQHEAQMRAIMQSFSAPNWKNAQERMFVIPDELLSMKILEEVSNSEIINQEGYKKLKNEFRSMIEEGLHPGAQLAVYYDGELVIHLAGGVKGIDGKKIMTSAELLEWHASDNKGPGHEPVTFNTLYQIRSVTKIMATLVMMMFHDQGRLNFDDRVAKHWPEFAQNGKENITIAHILSHRAGIPFLSHSLLVETKVPRVIIGDRENIASAIEETTPVWKPGEKNGYHGMTIGMVPDEIVARLTGKFPPMGDILRKEVFEPLGLKDIYFGLPNSQYDRMAKMNVLDPQTKNRKGGSDFLNSRKGIQNEMSWVGCVSTAKDLANFMNIFVYEGTYKGKKFFSKEVQKRASTPTNKAGEVDEILMKPMRWGLGFVLGDTKDFYGSTPRPRVIGHAGGGANVAWADPKNKLAVVFLCNGMKNRKAMERYRRIGDGVYGALNLNAK